MKKILLSLSIVALVALVTIAAVRQPFYAAGPSLVQKGTATTASDKMVTNTFATAYSSAPVVVVVGGTNDLAHIISITTTNVKFGAANATATLQWIAVGTP